MVPERHFESKQQLVAEANHAAFDRLLTMSAIRISGQFPGDALETIVALYLNRSQKHDNGYFCPSAMIGAELSHCELALRQTAMIGYQRLVQCLADRLTHLDKPAALVAAGGIGTTLVVRSHLQTWHRTDRRQRRS